MYVRLHEYSIVRCVVRKETPKETRNHNVTMSKWRPLAFKLLDGKIKHHPTEKEHDYTFNGHCYIVTTNIVASVWPTESKRTCTVSPTQANSQHNINNWAHQFKIIIPIIVCCVCACVRAKLVCVCVGVLSLHVSVRALPQLSVTQINHTYQVSSCFPPTIIPTRGSSKCYECNLHTNTATKPKSNR